MLQNYKLSLRGAVQSFRGLAMATLLLFCNLLTAQADSSTGLQVSATGDINGKINFDKDASSDNRLDVREAEILLYAPVDHLFDASFGLSVHMEGGKLSDWVLHETYFGSSKLIPRTRFRIGQYFLGVGRLNRFHRHDWPFITAPKVHEQFFGDEGALDTGIEASYLFPFESFVELTAGVTNGWVFGHSHTLGKKPYVPTHYARLAFGMGCLWNGTSEHGLNYIGRKNSDGDWMYVVGLDTTTKWKENKILTGLFQSELWYRIYNFKAGTSEKTFGFYLYPQYGLHEHWYLGFRFDGYKVTSQVSGEPSGFDYAFVPTLSFKPSEFSTLRLAYNHKGTWNPQGQEDNEKSIELQAVFMLGAHPSHAF